MYMYIFAQRIELSSLSVCVLVCIFLEYASLMFHILAFPLSLLSHTAQFFPIFLTQSAYLSLLHGTMCELSMLYHTCILVVCPVCCLCVCPSRCLRAPFCLWTCKIRIESIDYTSLLYTHIPKLSCVCLLRISTVTLLFYYPTFIKVVFRRKKKKTAATLRERVCSQICSHQCYMNRFSVIRQRRIRQNQFICTKNKINLQKNTFITFSIWC